MSALTAHDVDWIRTYAPWATDDDEIASLFVDLGSREAIAIWYVRSRLAAMIDSPTSFNVGGEYSESWSANIKALQDSLVELRTLVPGDESDVVGPHVTRMRRAGAYDARGWPVPHIGAVAWSGGPYIDERREFDEFR